MTSLEIVLLTAIQIDPEYADAYLRLGVVYSEQELFEEAAEQFKNLLNMI